MQMTRIPKPDVRRGSGKKGLRLRDAAKPNYRKPKWLTWLRKMLQSGGNSG